MFRDKPVDISRFRHLYPFESNYLDRNGMTYHFLDEGTGDPVLMVHGNPTWSFYFRELVKAVSPNFRAIVPDHIGCGLSDKPDMSRYDYRLKSRIDDLESLVDHLGLTENITMVVHDWGGAIGMGYALRRPESIKAFVVMNTAAFFHPQKKQMPFRLRAIRDLHLFAAVAVQGFNLFARGAARMASHKGLTKDVRSGLLAPYNCWKNRVATLKFVQDIPVKPSDPSYALVDDLDRNLKRLSNRPMLICWGLKDFVFNAAFLAEWARRFPGAEIHAFEDAGHYVLEDIPERIVPLVVDFLTAD
jgi:cis-3-alkyl-4-acyloxetan-2-one decarboxylase